MERDSVIEEGDNTHETLKSSGNLNIIENEHSHELSRSCPKSEESSNDSTTRKTDLSEERTISCSKLEDSVTCITDLTDKCGKEFSEDCKEKEDNVNSENDMNIESCNVVEASGGSEEEYSKPCQPCFEDNKNVDSLLYCVECEDYLCAKCVEMHRVVKPSKTHKLVPKEILDNPGDELKIDKKEECPHHFGEFLEWFCISDDQLCCNVCKTTEHIKCESVVAISSIAETTDMQNMITHMEETQSQLKDNIEKRTIDFANLDEDKNDSLQVLEEIKADTEHTFLRLKQSLVKENEKVETIYNKEKKRLSTDIENYSRIIKGIETTHTWLRKDNICIENKFIQMKKAEQHLQKVQKAIIDVTTAPLSNPIGYERDKQYHKYLGAFQRFGYFDDDKRIYACSKPIKVNILCNQEKTATVFDICEAGNDHILITDWYNGCLKLIDTNKGTIIGMLDTPNSPFGICKLGKEREFAVTITQTRKILFIAVTAQERIIQGISFETGENCYGIAYGNQRIYVTCGGFGEKEGPGHIKVFDTKGGLLKTFANGSHGYRLGFPCKLKFFPGETTLFVTDMGCLIQLNFDKDEIVDVKELNAIMFARSWYASLCFDPNGRILCSNSTTKSVYLLSKDYTRYESIVTGLKQSPCAIALDHSSLKLYVGLSQSSDLLCFQLENKKWEKPPTFD